MTQELSESLKQALEGFIDGPYAGNRARMALALRGVGLDQQRAALDYVRGIQTPHTARREELAQLLVDSMAYDVMDEKLGTKDAEKIGLSDEQLKRMANRRTS